MKINYILTILALVLFACNGVRVVKPLDKGQKQIGASFGGPMIKMGNAPVVMPLTSVHGAYGITKKTTGFASVHTTSLLFGVVHTDMGFTTLVSENNKYKPGITVSGIANAMIDHWEWRFSLLPQFDANCFWHYKQKPNLVYISLQNWFEPRSKRVHGEQQHVRWLPSIGIGHQWVKQKYNYQLECKMIGFNQNNQNLVVKYISPASNGALGLYFGIQRKF
ncbi:MAG: hypothetical protein ACK4K9_06970 [Bacteroidia bacterium]